jgi:hypothetical protein
MDLARHIFTSGIFLKAYGFTTLFSSAVGFGFQTETDSSMIVSVCHCLQCSKFLLSGWLLVSLRWEQAPSFHGKMVWCATGVIVKFLCLAHTELPSWSAPSASSEQDTAQDTTVSNCNTLICSTLIYCEGICLTKGMSAGSEMCGHLDFIYLF